MSSTKSCKNKTQHISAIFRVNIIKQSKKALKKIRQAGKYTYRPKMQKNMQMHAQNITQYACVHTIQNAEMKQTKKLQHSFCNILCIKTSNTTQKSPKQNIYAF